MTSATAGQEEVDKSSGANLFKGFRIEPDGVYQKLPSREQWAEILKALLFTPACLVVVLKDATWEQTSPLLVTFCAPAVLMLAHTAFVALRPAHRPFGRPLIKLTQPNELTFWSQGVRGGQHRIRLDQTPCLSFDTFGEVERYVFKASASASASEHAQLDDCVETGWPTDAAPAVRTWLNTFLVEKGLLKMDLSSLPSFAQSSMPIGDAVYQQGTTLTDPTPLPAGILVHANGIFQRLSYWHRFKKSTNSIVFGFYLALAAFIFKDAIGKGPSFVLMAFVMLSLFSVCIDVLIEWRRFRQLPGRPLLHLDKQQQRLSFCSKDRWPPEQVIELQNISHVRVRGTEGSRGYTIQLVKEVGKWNPVAFHVIYPQWGAEVERLAEAFLAQLATQNLISLTVEKPSTE